MPTIKVAAVQAEPVWLDLESTTTKTVQLIASAAAEGAQLVAFPETWIPGYPVFVWTHPVPEQFPFIARYHANSMLLDGPEIARIREAARAGDIMVVLGFSEKDHGSLYMAQLIIGASGEILLHRRKLRPTHAERTVFGGGDGSNLQVVSTPLGRVGALQCWEHIQPLVKFSMFAQHEQIHVASWPCLGIFGNVPNLSAHITQAITETYAVEGGAFTLMSTQIMSEEGAMVFAVDGELPFAYTGGGGHAAVYGPDSALLTTPLDPTAEGIVTADIDLTAIDLAKAFADPVGHYAFPDIFQLSVDRRERKPAMLGATEGRLVNLPELASEGEVSLA